MPEVARVRRRLTTWVLAPLLFLALAAGGARWWVAEMLQPVNPGAAEPVTVEIPPGTATSTVAQLLFNHRLVKEPLVFRYYARYRQLDGQLKPGEYQLSASMAPEQILQKLARGDVVIRTFTLPEGLTVTQIADLLAAKGLVDRDRFVELAAASHLADAYLPADPQLKQPLEGYLFPATYEYGRGLTETEILEMMFARFEQAWTPELQARAMELHLSVHEVLAMASIIEKEARVAAERPKIGGVYYNRLHIGMKLDADPAVSYAVDKAPGEPLLYKDLEVDSPYNSYMHPGLPPGPIAAPGEAALRAALWPETHDYWYFVARADGSGEHYFASTLAEQEQNIAKAQENADKQSAQRPPN